MPAMTKLTYRIKKRNSRCFGIASLLLCTVFSSSSLASTEQITSDSPYKEEHWFQMASEHPLAKQYAPQRQIYLQNIALIKQAAKTQPLAGKKAPLDLQQAKLALKDYPLLPYLEYEALRARFDSLPIDEVKAFQARYQGEYIERRLTSTWMSWLGKNQQLALFKQFNDSRFQNHSNRCYGLRADIADKSQNEAQALNTFKGIWLTGYSLPSACDKLVTRFEASEHFTQALIWQRFDLAFAQNNKQLATYLAGKMDKEAKIQAQKLLSASQHSDYWLTRLATATRFTAISNNQNPPKQTSPDTLQSNLLNLSSASYKRLLQEIAAVDNLGVAGLIENYRLPMSDKDWLAIKTLCAWYFAKHNPSAALTWIDQQAEQNSYKLQEKQLRYSLQAKDWPNFINSYDIANNSLQSQAEWQYWYAIALLETAQSQPEQLKFSQRKAQQQAESTLQSLSNKQHFYGLLASKYFKQNLVLNDNIDLSTWEISDSTAKRLSAAVELYLTGEHILASRQWYHSSKGFKRSQWREASALSHQLGWHERMLRAISSSGFGQEINEQYPLAFPDIYSAQADASGVDIGWLLALSRQESGFSPLVKSNKGAMGVMQIMPNTGKRLAKELKLKYTNQALNKADYNIRLGSYYLQKLLKRFDNNYVLATAAYNAGPHRVDEWLSLRSIDDDWAHWIATIPYKETRKYVQNILAYSHFYQQHLPENLRSDLKLTLFQPQK